MRIVVTTLIILLSILLVIFGAQNTYPVNVRFLSFQTGATSLSLVIVLSAVIGAMIVGLFATLDSVRRGLRLRRVNKERSSLESRRVALELQVAKLEEELGTLRAAPATPLPTQPLEAKAERSEA